MGEAKKTIKNLHEKVRANRNDKATMTQHVILALNFWEKTNDQAMALMHDLLFEELKRAERELTVVKWIKKLFRKPTRAEKFAKLDYQFDKWRVRRILGGMEELTPGQIAEKLRLDGIRVRSIMNDIANEQKPQPKVEPPPAPGPETAMGTDMNRPQRKPQVFDEGVEMASKAGLTGS